MSVSTGGLTAASGLGAVTGMPARPGDRCWPAVCSEVSAGRCVCARKPHSNCMGTDNVPR